jgi:hypothetical protein
MKLNRYCIWDNTPSPSVSPERDTPSDEECVATVTMRMILTTPQFSLWIEVYLAQLVPELSCVRCYIMQGCHGSPC